MLLLSEVPLSLSRGDFLYLKLAGGSYVPWELYMNRELKPNFLAMQFTTHFFILQVKDMLCSKPHCHKVLIELPFHIKLTCVRAHPNGDDITLESN